MVSARSRSSNPIFQVLSRLPHRLLLITAIVVFLIPYGLADAAQPAASRPTPPEPLPLQDAPTKYLDAAIRGELTERDVRLLVFAFEERQGRLPPGTTDKIAGYQAEYEAAQQQGKEPPPTRFLRDTFLVCDVDEDNVPDVAQNEIDMLTLNVAVRVISGADGHFLWQRFHYRLARPFMFFNGDIGQDLLQYERQGVPTPIYPDNFANTFDLNEDGVCDFLVYGMTWSGIGIDPQIVTLTTTYMAVNGTYGYYNPIPPYWTLSVASRLIITYDPPSQGALLLSIEWLDMPFAFTHFATPNGARFVLLRKDISWNRYTQLLPPQLGGNCYVKDWRTSDHVYYFDAAKPIDAQGVPRPIWVRDLNFSREYRVTDDTHEKVVNLTFIAGITDLGGDDEPEILLDQMQFTTPMTCPVTNPIDDSPILRYGRSVVVMALRGENGLNLWQTQLYDSGTARVNAKFEENFEELVWIYAYVFSDLTGDGTPEIFASYLMVEQNGVQTVNGRYSTHIHPLDGKTGAKLWPESDVRVQGWGYAAPLSADPSKSVPLFAMGTIDLPTSVAPGGRFPPKDVRLLVIDATDGTTRWLYREQFGQDSYLSYELTQQQYRSALAPYDWNGDGLNDLVSPSQYIAPTGLNQTLLSTTTHSYEIFNAVDGSSLHKVVAWGPTGLVLKCKPNDPQLTIVSGHARRLDISRFNVTPNVEQVFRFPIYNNPVIQGATLGTDLTFLGTQCIEALDGRVLFNVNMGLASLKRGLEIRNLVGTVAEDDHELDWIMPPVPGKPPLSPEELLKFFEVRTTPPELTLAFTAGPAIPGLVAGLGLAVLRRRRGALE